MDRRKFIKNTSIAGLTFTAIKPEVVNILSSQTNDKNMSPDKSAYEIDIEEITIEALQEKMKSGEYTSEDITAVYLRRIQDIDKDGPKINSVIELNPDAMSIARKMDDERKNDKVRGPLHGIPVMIKDNINTSDKMMTTAGSLALEGNIASEDAFIVKKLREAGAVILGKTNLSEWANFRSEYSSSGWSSRGGQTKCPYILERNPCGSSSGSGAAVAANLCVVAVGTETDGSIVCPSSVNGLVGIKPTVGLLSRSGIIPISNTQDTPGPMARTVKDAAILLGALTGVDPGDPVTDKSTDNSFKDYTQFLKKNGLEGKRIGVEKKMMGGNDSVSKLFITAVAKMKEFGAEIFEVEIHEKISELGSDEFEAMKFEFKDGLNRYLANSNAKVRSMKEVIEFNKRNEAAAMPFFKQDILESSEQKGGLESKEYIDAVNKILETSRSVINDTMKANRLDAISCMTMGPGCSIDLIYGDHYGGIFFSAPAAISGYPHITVPCGMIYGLPVGISFMGSAFSEPVLLSIAYSFEQNTMSRQKPKFVKTFQG
ncbi:MAG: amidase [Ignavibacteria bacterium]|nr:amidase [Ignavibacteria bacterium]